MEMYKKSLEIGIYDHLKNYFDSRGVGIITDKQLVWYTQYDLNDRFNHDTAMPYLDKKIYPKKNYYGFYKKCKDITIASMSNDLYISMPNCDTISKNQYSILCYFLNEIDKYNKEDSKKLIVNLFEYSNNYSIESEEMNIIKEALNKIKIREEIDEEEIIIGKTIEDINSLLEDNVDSKTR